MADAPNVRERRYEVDSNFDGWRLDNFLASRVGRISRSRAAEIAKHGDVELVPTRRPKPSSRLRTGDVVILREHLAPEALQDDEVQILYLDDELVILDKPPGMLVHEAASVRLNTVQMYLRRQGLDGAEPVHRIDRETSGLLVCARQPQWVPVLREMFATTHPEKVYRAIVLDAAVVWPIGSFDTIEIPLRLDIESRLGLRMVRGNLAATTHVRTLGRSADLADLEVQIETGRQHQIRVHLAMTGTPVAGDKLYTYDDDFFMRLHDEPDDRELLAQLPYARHMLHAWRIQFPHPRTGEAVRFESALPAAWRAFDA